MERLRDGTRIINVPLYELVRTPLRPGKSDKAILGVIIHEVRHDLYTPDSEEWGKNVLPRLGGMSAENRDIIRGFAGEKGKRKQMAEIHRLWNAVEDIRIDFMHDKRRPGEKNWIDAKNREFYEDMLTEEPDRKAKILLLAVKQPHVVLDNELLCYGFNGRHSAYFQYFPEELREDIESLTTGENSPLFMATRHDDVRYDFSKRRSSDNKCKPAAHSMRIFLERIKPLYMKWKERAIEPDSERKRCLWWGSRTCPFTSGYS